MAITGTHTLLYSSEPEQLRVVLRDVLGFKGSDIGHGWIIFALPPSEIAVHPADEAAETPGVQHQFTLMCDHLHDTILDLTAHGILACVGDRSRADELGAPGADLLARRVEQRAALGRVLVEACELLAVAAPGDHRHAGPLAFLEATEAVVGERQPVTALGVLALIDEVQAGLTLPPDDVGYRGGEAVLAGGVPGLRVGEASGVSGEDPVGATSHLQLLGRPLKKKRNLPTRCWRRRPQA